MIEFLKNKISGSDEHTIDVFKKSGGVLIVRVLSVILGFIVSIVLGRTLGTNGLGIFSLAEKITTIAMVVSLFGMSQYVIKNVAIFKIKNDWKTIQSIIYTAIFFSSLGTFILIVLLYFLSPFLSTNFFNEPNLETPLKIAAVAMIFQVVARVLSSGLNGLNKVWQSTFYNEFLSILLVLFMFLIMWLFGINLTIINVIIAYAISRFVVMIVLGIYWINKVPKKTSELKHLGLSFYLKGFPFLLVSATGLVLASIDSLMLGWLSTISEVGLYSVGIKIALLSSFFLQVTNSALSPKLASMFHENRIIELNKLVQKVTLSLIVLTILPLVLYVFFGSQLLGLWGEEFKEAYLILIILSIGQLFNVGTGASGLLLVMCGHEKIQAYITGITIVINVILNYILILKYGALGAAIATATSVAIENILKVILAYKKTGVLTLPLLKINKLKA